MWDTSKKNPKVHGGTAQEIHGCSTDFAMCCAVVCEWVVLFDAGCWGGIKDSNDFPFQTTANHRAGKAYKVQKNIWI